MKAFAFILLMPGGEGRSPLRREGSWKHIRDVVTMQMRKTVVFGWFRGLVKGVTFQEETRCEQNLHWGGGGEV